MRVSPIGAIRTAPRSLCGGAKATTTTATKRQMNEQNNYYAVKAPLVCQFPSKLLAFIVDLVVVVL